MNNISTLPRSVLSHAEPVLAVSSIADTVTYWHEVIGFPDKWMYGEPHNHGGVSWQGSSMIQFSLNSKLAVASKGQSVWIRVHDLHSLYAFHQQSKANVVAPMEDKPWGFSEYTLEDINGYYIHFSAPTSKEKITVKEHPHEIRIIARAPSINEFNKLMDAVGWTPSSGKEIKSQLKSTRFAVVAQNKPTKEIIGCALLMGDGVSFYYVKDVMVHPRWQHQRIGTTLMQEIMKWIDKNVPDKSTIGLFTGDQLANFYKQFGFIQACGMYQQIHRK